MPDCIAVINAGSSSVKFGIYQAGQARVLYRGQVESIGTAPRLRMVDANAEVVADRSWPVGGFDHSTATREIILAGQQLMQGRVGAIGHRVVHGGRSNAAPMLVTAQLLDELAKLIPLAPLHQPHNLAPIRTIMTAAPQMPQVVCFDTAFHRTQPHLAQAFALPPAITDEGVQRYGFHGLSYEYLVGRLRELSPAHSEGRVVIAHLGNGASLCAVKAGRSVASTMGFTAVDGLMMGTRCGAIDPGVILYLLQEHGMNAADVEDLIYRKSGLLGVSGISSDMRILRQSLRPQAREAIDLFVYRIIREVGSLAASLGGIDALVFSGGIGENDMMTRAEVVAGCQWLGTHLDPERNTYGTGLISSDASRVAVWVIPTDEELLIARRTAEVLAGLHTGPRS